MSYIYLQERGEESSAECFSDIPQFVLSKLNLTAKKSCSKDNETESCLISPFGMISAHSMDNLGVAWLMSSAEDSLAKISPLLTNLRPPELALKGGGQEVGCGKKWPESLAANQWGKE